MLKWSLSQLYKLNKKPFDFEETLDFHDRIENIDDILDISEVTVKGTGRNVMDDRYVFNIHIECTLYLECARTLESVEFPLSLDITEEFDTVEDYESEEEIRLIEKNTIDLTDVIWEDIYLEKPMRVFKEGTTEYVDQDIEEFYK